MFRTVVLTYEIDYLLLNINNLMIYTCKYDMFKFFHDKYCMLQNVLMFKDLLTFCDYFLKYSFK